MMRKGTDGTYVYFVRVVLFFEEYESLHDEVETQEHGQVHLFYV